MEEDEGEDTKSAEGRDEDGKRGKILIFGAGVFDTIESIYLCMRYVYPFG